MSNRTMLTENAIDIMVQGAELKEPLTVKIFPYNKSGSSNEVVTVFDCSGGQVEAIVLAPEYYNVPEYQNQAITVKVDGFVSSASNAFIEEDDDDADPILVCLASLQIVEVVKMYRKRNNRKRKHRNNDNYKNERIQGGIIPAFLSKTAPFLTNRQLAGSEATRYVSTERDDMETKLRDVQHFLSRHAALKTLHKNHHSKTNNDASSASSNNGNGESQSRTTESSSSSSEAETTKVYMSVLKDFQESQLDRQKATLTTNTRRQQNPTIATQIVNQHQAALQFALEQQGAELAGQTAAHDTNLTVARLKTYHSMLCGNGLLRDAGRLRTKNVRVGRTSFGPHETLPGNLQQLCQAIQILDSRLVQHCHSNNHNNNTGTDQAVSAIAFAAAVFLGIVDLHAFSDGNGRLARIACNWALHRAGFPFPVSLFATKQQRAEYSRAISQTRQNIDLHARGNVPEHLLVTAFAKVGALRPMVNLLLDRIHKAVTEFHKLLTEKQSLHSEQAEARAARKFRERAATGGTCLICFEAQPNIAALCCGKAIHLNCMAEWLSTNNSCPNCRSALPSIPERMRAAAPREQASGAGEEEDTTETVDSQESGEDNDDTTTMDDTSMASEDEALPLHVRRMRQIQQQQQQQIQQVQVQQQQQQQQQPRLQHDDDYDTISMDDTASEAPDTPPASRSNTDDDDDDTSTLDDIMDDTTSEAPDTAAQNNSNNNDDTTIDDEYCGHCRRNRAARDCENSMCGSCCVNCGYYQCERHS